VPEHQEFGVLGRLAAGQHHQAVEQAAGEQVEDREDHSAMISGREPAKARPDRVIEPHRTRLSWGTGSTGYARSTGHSDWLSTERKQSKSLMLSVRRRRG
jgi:hypothetical protein